ncbi:MAG TPA: NAD(P)-dependent oxidoreductase [Stellaceae bacterium]|nr:NAD(P)-dependent oxidoreductase [Stellaceae bacterium]
MLPLFIDLARLRLVLVGNGRAALRRLALLEEAGAQHIEIFAAAPSHEIAAAAGDRLTRRWPACEDLIGAQLVFIADVPEPERAALVHATRGLGVLVHVEDEPSLSDTQAPAVLRRGSLTLAVSTGGASPALASQLRDFLGRLFGPEWRGRVDEVSRKRHAWRKAGVAPETIAHLTGELVSRRGWLPTPATRH